MAGVRRYVLPSSCSIYGFQEPGVVCDETTPTNPLTTYAKANEKAEQGVLPLADDGSASSCCARRRSMATARACASTSPSTA